VIGHSLGGGLARALAGQRPDLVARIITLGFPQGGDLRAAGHPMMEALAERLLRDPGSGVAWAAERARMEELFTRPVPADVQLTSIYSRDDAVVDWRTCVISGPGCAAYEVGGSHVGLAWNAQVYRLIGRVLAG
jgi:pimeloyl-ACP methyl ester carboxylesterase